MYKYIFVITRSRLKPWICCPIYFMNCRFPCMKGSSQRLLVPLNRCFWHQRRRGVRGPVISPYVLLYCYKQLLFVYVIIDIVFTVDDFRVRGVRLACNSFCSETRLGANRQWYKIVAFKKHLINILYVVLKDSLCSMRATLDFRVVNLRRAMEAKECSDHEVSGEMEALQEIIQIINNHCNRQ